MGSPNRANPESMVGQFYDLDPVTTTLAAWAPKTGTTFARGFLVVTSGSLVVDTPGTADQAGSTSRTIPAAVLAVGQVYQLAISAIHATSVATVLPLY